MLLPQRCALCGRPGPAACPACLANLPCPLDDEPPAGVDAVVALCAYDGAGRDLVAALKYRGRHPVAAAVAPALAGLVVQAGLAPCDLVTWLPTTAARRHRRGYDQAEALARLVAARLGPGCRGVLHRASGPAQTGRSRGERMAAPPSLRPRRAVRGRVLLVDDVVTTGGSVGAAAAALRQAGASSVVVACVARTGRDRRNRIARPDGPTLLHPRSPAALDRHSSQEIPWTSA